MLEWLTSALGGGAAGVLLRIGNGFFEEFRAGREHSRKLEEAKVMAGIAADKAAWDAFTASQNASVAPSSTPWWAAAVITLFRPAITLLLLALVAAVFFRVTQSEQAGMISEIQFAAFNAIGWWFGDRMAVRMKKP
jgi:hypothetical protein